MSIAYQRSPEMTILFADVAGSVELSETYGDIQAHNMVVEGLHIMEQSVMRNHGKVIETVGDEVMAAFNSADFAFSAACAIQDGVQANPRLPISIRIGFHTGPTAIDNGHPFGDTVHVAARMVSIAKPGQVLISQQSYVRLSADNRRQTRHFHRILLKGKQAPTDIHEILWDDLECTKSLTNLGKLQFDRLTIKGVRLSYGQQEADVNEYNTTITTGRSEQCDLVVESDLASRLHASFIFQQGKVVLSDKSTNGTFVRTLGGQSGSDSLNLFIHHEDWVMQDNGVISLGEPFGTETEKLIHFRCY
ncbi:adenylate/guanylate cyclase domain-containing protein [Kaarinaea lacus]